MKAAVTTGEKRGIIVKDMPKPQVQPGTLLLKTKYCSICGSDLEYLDGHPGQYRDSRKLRTGGILGHEFSAEVVEVGEGVEGWSIGDRATIGGRQMPCGQCYWCRRGLYHLCLGKGVSPRAFLIDILDIAGKGIAYGGAMAEYFLRPPTGVQKVPDNVTDEEAALVEPLAVGVGSVALAGLKDSDSVVIIGAGKIGLGTMLCAKAAGVTPVIVIDIVKSRLDKALEMGADAALNANEVDVISEVVKLTEAGPDAVIICVRDARVFNQAVDMVRRAGTIVITGFILPMEVNPFFWIWKQLTIIGNLGQYGRGVLDSSMRLISQRGVNVKPLISAIMPLEEVQRAFDSMYSGENIVVLLKP